MKSFLRDYIQHSLHYPSHIRKLSSSLYFHAIHSNSHLNCQISYNHSSSVQNISSNGNQIPNLQNSHAGRCIREKTVSARKLFDTIPTRSFDFDRTASDSIIHLVKTWSSGLDPDQFDYGNALSACALIHAIDFGEQIFSVVIKNGFLANGFVITGLIDLFCKVGRFDKGLQVFEENIGNNVVCWNAIIAGSVKNNNPFADRIFQEMGLMKSSSTWSIMISSLAQNQNLKKASELFSRTFHEGFKPDSVCTSGIISIIDNIDYGSQLHSYVLKTGLVFNVHVASALFTMYSKCGNIEHSYNLFTQMNDKDKVSWTSMISGFSFHGRTMEAFQLFREMIIEGLSPDQTTICAILTACSCSEFLIKGKEIHAHAVRFGFKNDTTVGSSLVSMYLKCKNLASATRVFLGIQCKDQAMWSALISGYASNNYNKEALKKFHQMLKLGFELDHILVSSILGVCADLSKPIIGEQLHSYGIKKGFILNLSISSSLVSMYSKCGNIGDSCKLFDEIRYPDVVTWTAIIDGYAQHGRGLEALDIFEKMKDANIKPDSVAFLSILTACNHNGLVEEGLSYFNAMKNEYGIEPEQQHYASIADLLGRSGRLKEAKDFIDKMPVEPDWLVWSPLLSACRAHGDLELGKIAASKVSVLAPNDSGTFISSSNICAEIGDWEEVERIRSSMKDVGLKKDVGFSAL